MSSDTETLELYRVMVETITANEHRRQQISSVFVTLLAAGVGAAGAIQSFNLVYLSAPAIVVSLVWFAQVSYLKRLAAAKFQVIGQLEEKFSFQPFAEEWRLMDRESSNANRFRLGLSDIEMIIPLAVFVASAAHLFWTIFSSFA